jgi:hypothetical protein
VRRITPTAPGRLAVSIVAGLTLVGCSSQHGTVAPTTTTSPVVKTELGPATTTTTLADGRYCIEDESTHMKFCS